MSVPDLTPSTDDALRKVLALAHSLREGDGEDHVRASARELESACSRGEGVRAAIDRLSSSVRQLQADLSHGSRRREQHDAVGIEHLLEVLQEELLPTLRHSGLI